MAPATKATPERITDLLLALGPMTRDELAMRLDCHPGGVTFSWTLRGLLDDGRVVRHKTGRGAYVYDLARENSVR